MTGAELKVEKEFSSPLSVTLGNDCNFFREDLNFFLYIDSF